MNDADMPGGAPDGELQPPTLPDVGATRRALLADLDADLTIIGGESRTAIREHMANLLINADTADSEALLQQFNTELRSQFASHNIGFRDPVGTGNVRLDPGDLSGTFMDGWDNSGSQLSAAMWEASGNPPLTAEPAADETPDPMADAIADPVAESIADPVADAIADPAGMSAATDASVTDMTDLDATELPSEPQNTGIVPPSLQGESDPRVTMPAETADGLVDDFDAMLEAEASALGNAADDVVSDVLTAPAAAADGTVDDVLGDLLVTDAVLGTPVPEMAEVGAAADPLGDVVMDSPPPLVDDFEIEIPAEPEITFEEPEFEPAMADFEVDTDVDDLVAATDDASDDFLNP